MIAFLKYKLHKIKANDVCCSWHNIIKQGKDALVLKLFKGLHINMLLNFLISYFSKMMILCLISTTLLSSLNIVLCSNCECTCMFGCVCVCYTCSVSIGCVCVSHTCGVCE